MKNLLTNNQVIDLSYELFQDNKKSFVGYSALMFIIVSAAWYMVFLVIYVIIILLVVGALSGVMVFGGGDVGSGILAYYILIVVCIMPTLSIFQLLAAGPVQATDAYRKGEKINFSNMFSYSFKKILYIITAALAYLLVVTLLLIVVGAICLAIYQVIGNSYLILSLSYCVVGLVAFVAYVWFSIRSLFYLPIALNEKKHFFGAVIQSFRMTKGRFFSLLQLMFTRWVSLLAIYICTQGLVSVVSALLMQVFQSDDVGAGMIIGLLLIQVVMSVFQFGVSIFLMPIVYLTIPTAYINERNIKYADDLILKIDGFLLGQKHEGLANANI